MEIKSCFIILLLFDDSKNVCIFFNFFKIFSILSEENNKCIMRNFVSEDESNSICDPCSVILEDPLEITEEGNGELQHSPVQVLNNKQVNFVIYMPLIKFVNLQKLYLYST